MQDLALLYAGNVVHTLEDQSLVLLEDHILGTELCVLSLKRIQTMLKICLYTFPTFFENRTPYLPCRRRSSWADQLLTA